MLIEFSASRGREDRFRSACSIRPCMNSFQQIAMVSANWLKPLIYHCQTLRVASKRCVNITLCLVCVGCALV